MVHFESILFIINISSSTDSAEHWKILPKTTFVGKSQIDFPMPSSVSIQNSPIPPSTFLQLLYYGTTGYKHKPHGLFRILSNV